MVSCPSVPPPFYVRIEVSHPVTRLFSLNSLTWLFYFSMSCCHCYNSAFRCMADPAPQAPTGQTAPDSCRLWQPQGSKVWARLQSQVSLSVQFTRIFYIYAKQARKQRVQSSHGVRRLWAIPCKDLQLRWGKDGSADNCLSKASSRRAAKIISPNATA